MAQILVKGAFWNALFQINNRIRGKNLVEIVGPMLEKLEIFDWFHLECPKTLKTNYTNFWSNYFSVFCVWL
jgi:hypothetical protein